MILQQPWTFPILLETEFQMRPYQLEAIEKAVQWLFEDGHRSGILQMATGSGKTSLVGGLVRRLYLERKIKSRVLFLAHRTELVTQSYACFERSGLAPGREQASHRMFGQDYDPQIVCATVQTVHARLEEIDPETFDFVVVDECHCSASRTFLEVINHFSKAKVLGITATIDRADGKSLGHLNEVIYRYSLWDGIRDGYLAPIKFVRCSVGANLRDCRTIGKSGEFDLEQLGLLIQPHIEVLANAIKSEIKYRKTIAFMPCVKSAQGMASALTQLGVESDWVSGDRPGRRNILERHQANKFTVLVNCQLLTEGYDDPSIECVVPRPTRSRISYCQQVGRGTRLAPNKEFCRVIDFDHLTDMDLIGPGSLAELSAAEEKSLAKAMSRDAEVDLWKAVEQAREKVKTDAEALQVSVRHLELQYRRVEVNPFEAGRNLGIRTDYGAGYGEKATQKQADLLGRIGVAASEQLSRNQASRIIQSVIDRRKDGLATLKQLSYLISMGVDRTKARRMSFDEASDAIARLRHG